MWIIGDSFVGATGDHYFQRPGQTLQRPHYIKEQYDTSLSFNNKHYDPILLSRLRNVLAKLISDKQLLPKAIILILDNDLIRYADHDKDGFNHIMTKYIIWLADAMVDLIDSYKEKLSTKSKKENYPKILWVESPLHTHFEDNHLRKKYNSCLQETLDNYQMVMPIRLKKEWNADDIRLFEHNRFTSLGLIKYWSSIDLSFKHWDTIVDKHGLVFRSMMNQPQDIYGKPNQQGRGRGYNAQFRKTPSYRGGATPHFKGYNNKGNRFKWVKNYTDNKNIPPAYYEDLNY